jgi:hypothetical protein
MVNRIASLDELPNPDPDSYQSEKREPNSHLCFGSAILVFFWGGGQSMV